MLKIVTIVGARPQFIKAAAISRTIRKHFFGRVEEVMLHTGQHFDENMSKVFFDDLDIPAPKYNLEVSGGGHGSMTGRMLESIERILIDENPDWVLIYGDTNSTLAGALAAAKLHIPIAHVEAGLRSFNMRMPEEVNRILSDRVSTLLFCPTESAVENLKNEGIVYGVSNVGDVMYDVALNYAHQAKRSSKIVAELDLTPGAFILATCHRAENTDNPVCLKGIVEALSQISQNRKLVLPLHPRMRKNLVAHGLLDKLPEVTLLEPLSFLDMVALEQAAALILTDSGGVQKEAYFHSVPCVTMRNETEWIETVESGWNVLVGTSAKHIIEAVNHFANQEKLPVRPEFYGQGDTAMKIVSKIHEYTFA